jgi:hypothetical protein
MIFVKDGITEVEGFTEQQFTEIAGKLKNSVYPKALIDKPTAINE